MSNEGQPLQFDLFSGELVDNRNNYQKRKDKQRNSPQQINLFSTPEMAELSQNARPWLNDAPAPILALEIQETRTLDEIERDLMRAAQRDTLTFLEDPPIEETEAVSQAVEVSENVSSRIIFDASRSVQPIGLRAKLRAQSISVRAHCSLAR